MGSVFSSKAGRAALTAAFNYVEKDPEKNILKLMNTVNKLAGDNPNTFPKQRAAIQEVLENPDHHMHKLVMAILRDLDPEVTKTIYQNFFINANLIGWPMQQQMREKYGGNIPWSILLDPTSACNLHCTGCWAAEYGNRLNLSVREIDDIIHQGKELGVYFYIYTGGEPMVWRQDLIAICAHNSDCQFMAFTNGTLIDEAFAEDMLRVKNFIPVISIEGDETATDSRRGSGTYQKVLRAMTILKEKRLPFGISCCYTSQNYESITSDSFMDSMIDRGALFAWYFHYMPVGNDASPDLLLSPEQREHVYHRIRTLRSTKPIFAMDFQNDGKYVGGCIAGGRRYLHINANGDCDPCVFVHYSDSNIHEKTLLEVLQSPLFMAYHDGQPFNENHLRPCPMLENPERLRAIIHATGAHSTDLQSPEAVDHLCDKCVAYAENWAPTADRLWEEDQAQAAEKAAVH
ncbi:MAG: radical SAM protein [Oscillospiraceae bacterium]|nr:radical SAM protein [Oscillospiraceae bacterium]